MAETFILDRSPQAHIPATDLRERVVVFRQGASLAVKAASTIRINGQAYRDRAVFVPGVPTAVEDLTMTLEELHGSGGE